MLDYLQKDWQQIIGNELDKLFYQELFNKIDSIYQTETIFPPKDEVFKAFELTSVDNIKVVILGQDPYHNVGQAHGLSFSVKEGVDIPPSLKNIFKLIEKDLNIKPIGSGDLTRWAKQGVLLLNSTLTVEPHKAGSHQKLGWEKFTDMVIRKISENKDNIVFILWGSFAIGKKKFIDEKKHLVLESVHPSPLSAHRGFFDCQHFSKCNEYLQSNGKEGIDWR